MTLSDVARIAGVSPITASRALNTPEAVSPETLERVREAVSRTGYIPNRIAGGLASSRSRLVAAVVPSMAAPVFLQTMEALTDALEEAGYQLMLGQSGYAGSREDALLAAIIGRRPDAIVLTGVMRSPEGRRRLIASGIPVVETWDLTPTPIDMLVGFSHERVGEAVASHLVANGRKRPAVITADDERALRRARAFSERAMQLLDSSPSTRACPTHVVPAPAPLGAGREGLATLLQHHSGIDAIFCSSDLLALGVLIEAQARRIQVPERIAVVGFGDVDLARDAEPPLTSVCIDGAAIGRQAARFIIDRIEGEEAREPVIDVGFTLTRRASA